MVNTGTGEMYIPGSGPDNPKVPIFTKAGKGLAKLLKLSQKNPELEQEDYKIDTHLTIDEKLQHGRKKVPYVMYYMPPGKSMEHIKITMLVKDMGKGAYVIEYIPNDPYEEGKQPTNGSYFDNGGFLGYAASSFIPVRYDSDIPESLIGTQKFTYEAAKKLGLLEKMPRDFETFKKACGNDTAAEITKKHFSHSGTPHLAGQVDVKKNALSGVGSHDTFLLGNGRGVICNDITISPANMPSMVAGSVRLIKE